MKRLILFLISLGSLHAVGTVTQSLQQLGSSNVYVLAMNWTGDSMNGSVPATPANLTSIVQGFRIFTAEFAPGSPAPTNPYSITLTTNSGVDIFAAGATSLSATAASSVVTSSSAPPINGTLTLNVTGNSIGGAQGRLLVYLAPVSQVEALAAPGVPGIISNNTFTGTNTFTGSTTTGSLNGVLVVGSAIGQYGSLQAAHDALPSSGGSIFVTNTGFPFGVSNTTALTITKPVNIKLDAQNYTYAGSATNAITCSAAIGVVIEGGGRRGADSGASATTITISNTAAGAIASTNCEGMRIRGLNLIGPGSGTGKGIYIQSNRNRLESLNISSFGSDGVTIDGSVNNANLNTMTDVRVSLNGGVGVVLKGTNGNVATLSSVESAFNTGNGFNISSFGHSLIGTNANNNGTIGYHFLSGGSENFGVTFADTPAPQTTGYQFDSGANGNEIHNGADVGSVPVTDNGSGNRYYSALSTWFVLTSNAFISSTANPSTAGILRGAASDQVCWRNNANNANVCLARAGASDSLTWPNAINAGTNFNGVSTSLTGNVNWTETTASGAGAGLDACYGDSTAHAVKCSYNNGAEGYLAIPRVVGSGTATMTTAAITAGNCGTTVTVASANVATTDTIIWAFNAAPAGSNAGIVAWPTSGNVNFAYCPNSAETPAAATINWRVER